MLFYVTWADEDDEDALLIEVADEATARAAAIEEVGKKPKKVRPLPPNTVAFRVVFEEDDEDEEGELVTFDPLPHVVDMIGVLEDADLAELGAAELPRVTCMSEAEDDAGKVLRCERSAQHVDEHKAGDLTWPNERAPRKAAGAR